MIYDFLKLALINLTHRRMRSLLTIIGIFIGIAAVVSLIAVGQGLQDSISEQFEALGTNVLTVTAGASLLSGAPGSSMTSAEITEDDLEVIQDVRGVDYAAGFHFKLGKVRFGDELKYTYVLGYTPDKVSKELFESMGLEIDKGRDLEENDRYSAVIGSFVVEDLFSKEVGLRSNLEMEGQKFKVVGIVGSVGNPQDDSQIYIPLDTFREIFEEPDAYAMILVEVQDGFETDKVKEDLEKELRKSRDVEEGEEDFQISSSEQLLETFSSILGIVQLILVGIAAISLLVGGVGIMNTMYTSVLERTKEIGVMKAIGARNSHILLLFLFESGMLGLVGGLVGVGIGIGLSKSVDIVAAQMGYSILKTSVNPELIFGALGFSFFVGILSGVLPARKAAKLKPVDALRYE